MSKNTHLEIPFFHNLETESRKSQGTVIGKVYWNVSKDDKANAHETCRFKNNMEYTGQHEWI